MKHHLYKLVAVSSASFLPLVGYAQTEGVIGGRLSDVTTTLQKIIAVLFVLATVVFLWGVIQFISSAEDETKRNKAKGVMTWGIIGLAVMAAAWGVVTILIQYFGVGSTPIPENPFRF